MKRPYIIAAFAAFVLVFSSCLWGCAHEKADNANKEPTTTKPDESGTDGTTDTGNDDDTQNSDGQGGVVLPPKSILTYFSDENSAQLVSDMDAGRTPTECVVLYDQMGALPSVTLNDEEDIRKIYELVCNITVLQKSDYSITDNYHYVGFTLQDGTNVGFNFEGEGNLVGSKSNYAVRGDGPLWSYVRMLQGAKTEGWYAIGLDDEDDLVISCPDEAAEGETVRIETYAVEDAVILISVDGDQYFGSWVNGFEYEFTMPDHAVWVKVWASTEGIAGS